MKPTLGERLLMMVDDHGSLDRSSLADHAVEKLDYFVKIKTLKLVDNHYVRVGKSPQQKQKEEDDRYFWNGRYTRGY